MADEYLPSQAEAMAKSLLDTHLPSLTMADEYLPSQAEAMAKSLLDTHLPSPATNEPHHSNGRKLIHVVMIPYPVQGQINPMIQLAEALAKAAHNFIITFVNNEHHHKRIQENRSKSSSSSSNAESGGQEKLRFVWVDNGLPPDFDYNDLTSAPARMLEYSQACANMKDPFKDLVESLNKKSPPVTCIVSGFLCHWAHSVAADLHIPSVFFWPQSAAVFSILYHTTKLVSNGFFPCRKGGCNDLVSYIPGVPPLHFADFPTFLRADDATSQRTFKAVKEQFNMLETYHSVIINSYEDLEKDACQELRAELSSRLSFVGPLLPSAFLQDGSTGRKDINGAAGEGLLLHKNNNDCIKWLDSKQEKSVLYISFGSMFNPSAEDLQAIALGIKASKQPFLWAIRPRSSLQNVSEILLENFLEDTKDDGLIIPWAPQLQVLSHPSVGAFLTHCGWNSTLESLSMGMPMIPFPLHVDQATNCKFVVDIWKVGMSINKRPDHAGKVESEEVERVVRTVLQGGAEGREMRRRVGKLRDAARRAVQAQGASKAHLKNFIEAITSWAA